MASLRLGPTLETRAVDGVIKNPTDTFSRKTPKVYDRAVITFDSEGKKK